MFRILTNRNIPLLLIVLLSCGPAKDLVEIKNTIVQTDLDFSLLSKEAGMVEAFQKYADARCVLLREGSFPIIGKDEMIEYLNMVPAENLMLIWNPMFAEVSESGDLGYTYGTYEIRMKEEQDEFISDGCYVSIWKKQPDGSWKFVLDTGTEGLGNIE